MDDVQSIGLPTLHERGSMLAEARRELRSLVRYRNLVRHLMQQSLSKESTGRVFGAVWWLVDPLVSMGVYFFFVDVILDNGGEDFVFFVLIGLLAWKHVTSGTNGAITATLVREQTMRQVAFPRTVLPVSSVLAETFHFILGIGVFVAVAIPFGIYPTLAFPLVFVVMAVQVVLVLGISFVVAALNVFYRDVQNLTGYLLRIGMILAPVLYPLSRIPEEYQQLYKLNPFAILIPAYREVLMDGAVPNMTELGLVAAASLVALVVGFLTFVRLQAQFAKVA
jgi:lipopolysaccharide transport system permease protein